MTRLAVVLAVALLVASCGEGGGVKPKVRIGDPAPPSLNRVVAPGGNWRDVSTMDTKVPLYRWRIADLVAGQRPFLVVFGTPQHCTMCVDQLVRVAALEEKFGERFAFIHVDGYKDNAVWVEWGIKGEPWTFIVDARGRVQAEFAGPTDASVLEREIQRAIGRA